MISLPYNEISSWSHQIQRNHDTNSMTIPKEISAWAWKRQERVMYEPLEKTYAMLMWNLSIEYLFQPKLYFLSDSTDFSCVCYYGDSYLEFQNVVLNPQNSISLEFQTFSSYGLLLYVKQDSNLVDGFFIQLFIENGTLKVSYSVHLIFKKIQSCSNYVLYWLFSK